MQNTHSSVYIKYSHPKPPEPFITPQKMRNQAGCDVIYTQIKDAVIECLQDRGWNLPHIEQLIYDFAISPFLYISDIKLTVNEHLIDKTVPEVPPEYADMDEKAIQAEIEAAPDALTRWRQIMAIKYPEPERAPSFQYRFNRNVFLFHRPQNIDSLFLNWLYMGIQFPSAVSKDDRHDLNVTSNTSYASPYRAMLKSRHRKLDDGTEFILRSIDEMLHNNKRRKDAESDSDESDNDDPPAPPKKKSTFVSTRVYLSVSPQLNVKQIFDDLKVVFTHCYLLLKCSDEIQYLAQTEDTDTGKRNNNDTFDVMKSKFVLLDRPPKYVRLVRKHFRFIRMVKVLRVSGRDGMYTDKYYCITFLDSEELRLFFDKYESKRCWWNIDDEF